MAFCYLCSITGFPHMTWFESVASNLQEYLYDCLDGQMRKVFEEVQFFLKKTPQKTQ